ncbi:MAG: class I SAM-dependent methyltransferase [Chloroflexi bacterium]|nr:class I SAM-dependent methyltransferase [Chloroflexota bacterium]
MSYDAIGDAYDLVYPDTKERVPFVKDLLKTRGKNSVLEIGIGTGLFAIPLYEDGFNIDGLELSQVMIDVVGERAPGLKVHKGDMRDFKIDRRYDAILALSSVLVFVANEQEIKKCLQCCYDHLESKGILLLELPNHAVEIGHSNNSQEMHQSTDQSTIVVIQSAVEGQDWNETWHVFRNNGIGLTYSEVVCQEFLYSPETLAAQLQEVGFDIVETHGDLLGGAFDESTSWRRVLICEKRD